ncbi:DUF4426 domain-containing protein [Massilia scottii]|uniref:DUF4426 domain-containing protein n=1 Tax=Massilia scottii TaxID=3057166 RepID=UPI002796B6D9|nr:DUF4426 domain-containing protein [Massilia sp. CCM 9029]MDQ1834155.1 DUF4426 domain-containing protein [Massilia sp. CCM 9029]
MHITSWIFALALLVLPATSWSQAHEQQFGAYTLHSSTVGSENLSPQTARKHGIERSPTRAVLNVTLSKDKQTIPAQVDVSARSLTGQTRQIGMQETRTGNDVSYTGSYEFVHGEVLDFTIHATPRGSDKVLSMAYRERLWGPGDLPEPAPRQGVPD